MNWQEKLGKIVGVGGGGGAGLGWAGLASFSLALTSCCLSGFHLSHLGRYKKKKKTDKNKG